jgi:integrase/recombinase XerC
MTCRSRSYGCLAMRSAVFIKFLPAKGAQCRLNTLSGKNRSAATIRAYQTDIQQFIAFLHANNVSIHYPAEVQKIDVMEYLSALAKKELTGIARARKMSAIREYFRFLEGVGVISKSPTTGIETPKREKNGRQVLRSDEYTKMLSLAGANPRDYAVLQVFLQTGIRVSELANLTRNDIDFVKPAITVRGKGSVQREIALEKKGLHALKSYLAVRPESLSERVFLNYQGEPISERGIRKLVVKYRKEAGITKKASCHTLRHTFATCKAEKGVSAYQLQQWLGHANLNTTQIYIHLGKQNARKIMQDTSI